MKFVEAQGILRFESSIFKSKHFFIISCFIRKNIKLWRDCFIQPLYFNLRDALKNFHCLFYRCLRPNNQKSLGELDFSNFVEFWDKLNREFVKVRCENSWVIFNRVGMKTRIFCEWGTTRFCWGQRKSEILRICFCAAPEFSHLCITLKVQKELSHLHNSTVDTVVRSY